MINKNPIRKVFQVLKLLIKSFHKRNKQKDIKIQIEMIGAAATLVAERFKNNNIDISRESAILLYNGILNLSQTI